MALEASIGGRGGGYRMTGYLAVPSPKTFSAQSGVAAPRWGGGGEQIACLFLGADSPVRMLT